MKRYKFWLKNCPKCGELVDSVGFTRKVTLKHNIVNCPKCNAELKSTLRPKKSAKLLCTLYFPVAVLLLSASVYVSSPYNDMLFVTWFLFTAVLLLSLFGSYTLEKTAEPKS